VKSIKVLTTNELERFAGRIVKFAVGLLNNHNPDLTSEERFIALSSMFDTCEHHIDVAFAEEDQPDESADDDFIGWGDESGPPDDEAPETEDDGQTLHGPTF
jgi:hypothetical protein